MMKEEIIIAGFGGQGVLSMGKIWMPYQGDPHHGKCRTRRQRHRGMRELRTYSALIFSVN